MNRYEQQIFDIYRKMKLGKNLKCFECQEADNKLCEPVSIYHVGDKFDDGKLMFIGKTAVDAVGKTTEYGFWDARDDAKGLYHKSKGRRRSAFWTYTETIADKLFGKGKGWDYIAIDNMVKCNSNIDGERKDSADRSTATAIRNCTECLKREIEVLKPKNIVLYTSLRYEEAIESVFDRVSEIKVLDKPYGKYTNLRSFIGTLNGVETKVIRTGHPQGKPKDDFVRTVVELLKK